MNVPLISWLWSSCWQAAAIALAVLLVAKGVRKAPAVWRHALWVVVLARLFVPPIATLHPDISPVRDHLAATAPSHYPVVVNPSHRMAPLSVLPPAPGSNGGKPAATRAVPSPPESLRINWVLIVLSCWGAGSVLAAAVLLRRVRRQKQLLTRSILANDDAASVLKECAGVLGVRRLPELRVCRDTSLPMVMGVLRPVILLPPGFLEVCDPNQIRAVLLHELAHTKRMDVLVAWLCAIAKIPFFFHPAVWLACGEIRREQELACDEMVLLKSKMHPQAYASGYVAVLEFACCSARVAGAPCMAESFKDVEERVRLIMSNSAPRFTWKWAVSLVVLGACMMTSVSLRGDHGSNLTGQVRQADVEIELQHAKDLQAAGQYEAAIKTCGSLTSGEPYYAAQAYLCIGEAHREKQRYQQAAESFSRGIELAAPGAGANGSAWDLLRRLKFALVQVYTLTGDDTGAIELYKKLAVEYPGEAGHTHFCLASVYQSQGKHAEAIAAIKKGIEVAAPEERNDLSHMIYWAGRSYMAAGDYKSVLATVDELARLYPDFKDRHVLVWESLCRQSRTSEAVAYLDTVFDQHPDTRPEALLWKAEALFIYSKDTGKAIPVLERLVADYPDHPLTITEGCPLLAMLLARDGRVDEAVEAVKAGLPADATPEQKAASLHRTGNIYHNAKQYRDAIKVFKEVRQCDDAPDEIRAEAAYKSGLCYRAIRYNDSARMCMEEVVKRYPDSRWAKQARVELYVWLSHPGQE